MGELKSLVSCPFGDDGEEFFSTVDVSSCNYRKKARNGQMKNSMFSSSRCCVTQWFWNECRATEKKNGVLGHLPLVRFGRPDRSIYKANSVSQISQFPNCMHYSDEIFIKIRENC